MTDPRPTRLVLVFALSEQGRQDAFRLGHKIPAGNFGSEAIIRWTLDKDSDPELFERAASLELLLSEDGDFAEVPIGSIYTDRNDWWRTRHGRPLWAISVPLTFAAHQWFVPEAPRARRLRPDVLHDAEVEQLTLEDLADNDSEAFADNFTGFDHWPAVDELIEFEEARVLSAVEPSPSFEEEGPALQERYEAWVEETKSHLLRLFDEWAADIGPDELPEADLNAYRDDLLETTAQLNARWLTHVFSDRPIALAKQLTDARRNAQAEAQLAEASEWSASFGSKRLQRIATEGLLGSSLAVYRDERLAAERPGWDWLPTSVTLRDPAAPSDEEFELLDTARLNAPDATLRFATLGKGNGRFVAVAQFLDRNIWYPGDALTEIEGAAK